MIKAVFSVCGLIIVGNEAQNHSFISKFNNRSGAVRGHTVVCVERVEQGTQNAALRGSYVQGDGVGGELAHFHHLWLGVDRYAFFRADADTDYYRPTITDILNRYMSGVKMTINVKILNNKGSDKNCLPWCWLHFLLLSSSMHPSTIRVI